MFDYVSLFQSIPHQLATLLIAMIPIAELRGAIPIAIGIYKLPIWQAVLYSVIGNIIPAIFIVYLIGPISRWLIRKSETFRKFFNWLFERTRRKFEGKYQVYGEIALVIFVAIPLPVTGAWTGSVASFLFNIPPKRAVPLIFLGVCIAAVVVTLLTTGAIGSYNILNGK